ncbi:helix-turn-helix transcriptional regulator [Irregularibacter muris]|uniref:Helix-turn-helix transcriptional regulator n=1 Tax=Irregularibacter muris TaxID=1796619 RepID=A0AAE3HC95_9FIRM|nr:helix-turn-helix transcriptional regulator [Irregularibacter muris]MCR1897507.1 helix-turn-helix transcriptional regulator [Irregularibacter muris]
MKDHLVFKNNLKKIRAEQHISQQELADMVGVSRNSIGSIEKGQYTPSAKLALIIAIALNKTFEEVFFIE